MFVKRRGRATLKLSSFSSGKIFPVLLRSLQQLVVIIHLIKTLARIYHAEFAEISLFKLISHLLVLLNLLLSFFLGHPDLFTCQHALLHDNLVLVDPLLLALGAQVEQIDGVGDQFLFDS